MRLNDFTGGLVTRVHPSLISPISAVTYTNCDNEAGILKGIKTPSAVLQENAGAYATWYRHSNEVYSESVESYFAEYRDTLYMLTANGNFKYKDGVKRPLGIAKPINQPSISLNGAGGLEGTYQYRYTYYNDNDGSESQPSTASDELVANNNTITVSGFIASSDTQVTHIRLYRIGGDLSQYTLVEDIDKSSTNYTDNSSDTAIAGNHILDTITDVTPLEGMKYLTKAYAMLFASYEDKLYFTNIDEPEHWSRLNFIDFEDTITGIGATQHGLLVFTKYSTYIVTGNSPTTFSKYLLDNEYGCVNHRTISYTNSNLVWLSAQGVCSSNGGNVTLITHDNLGLLDVQDSINAVVMDKMYHLATSTYILVVDFRYNRCIRKLRYSNMSLVYYHNKVHGIKAGKIMELYAGSTYEFMRYASGWLTEGEYSNLKHYKDFYISYEGDLKVKIVLHTETGTKLIVNKRLPKDRTQFDIKSLGDVKGYAIQFRVYGIGEVREIQYKVVGRENAR